MTLLIMSIRFVCEIIALIIFGLWGFHQGKIVGAIGVPLMIGIIWAMLGSPYKLQGFYGVMLELFLFLAASYALYNLGLTYLALTYGIVALGIAILIRYMNI